MILPNKSIKNNSHHFEIALLTVVIHQKAKYISNPDCRVQVGFLQQGFTQPDCLRRILCIQAAGKRTKDSNEPSETVRHLFHEEPAGLMNKETKQVCVRTHAPGQTSWWGWLYAAGQRVLLLVYLLKNPWLLRHTYRPQLKHEGPSHSSGNHRSPPEQRRQEQFFLKGPKIICKTSC